MKTLMMLAWLASAGSAGAKVPDAVYRCSKPGQSNTYQNHPLPGAVCKRIALDPMMHAVQTAKPGVITAGTTPPRLFLNKHGEPIARHAKAEGVDPALVRAVIHAESAFDPKAVSRAGAQGLMQLMPATAQRFGVNDPFSADENIEGGVKYLAWLLERYKGDVTKVAAAYNAGEGRVDRHGGVPPFKETQAYVGRVQSLYASYQQAAKLVAIGS